MLHTTPTAVPEFSRLGLRAYSRSQMVDLSFAGGDYLAALITLSNYGARLKAPGHGLGLVLGDRADFNLVIREKGLSAGRIPCRVTWVEDGEVEVSFATRLEITMGEAQAAIDH